jgi:peptidoglycan/xylan/chitin deacetylase (PgdA/CDA1 family)
MEIHIPFSKTNIEKVSCSFTWDDNSLAHADIIHPIFNDYGLSATFYVVPGEDMFRETYAEPYSRLSLLGHEIGSHTYSHPHMTSLTASDAKEELTRSADALLKLTGRFPTTFAFPHHDYDQMLLGMARSVHFETRNTLNNARRFSLKTATLSGTVRTAIEAAIEQKENIIFSGHSVISSQSSENEYEPIPPELLIDIIKIVSSFQEHIEIITFEQAAIKEYVKMHTKYDRHSFWLSPDQLSFLERVGLNVQALNSIA